MCGCVKKTSSPGRLVCQLVLRNQNSWESVHISTARQPTPATAPGVLGDSGMTTNSLSCPLGKPMDIFSRIHCCIAEHRRTESESISRRTETLSCGSRVAESPAQSESLRPTSFKTKTYVLRVLFHCALALCCGIEGFCGQLCHEDEFFHGCAKVGAIMTIQRNC